MTATLEKLRDDLDDVVMLGGFFGGEIGAQLADLFAQLLDLFAARESLRDVFHQRVHVASQIVGGQRGVAWPARRRSSARPRPWSAALASSAFHETMLSEIRRLRGCGARRRHRRHEPKFRGLDAKFLGRDHPWLIHQLTLSI